MHRLPLRLGVIGLSGLLFFGPLSPMASAAALATHVTESGADRSSSTWAKAEGEFSLTVSPTRMAIGQDQVAAKQLITVINHSSVQESVQVQKRDFVAGADGTVVFQDTAPYSASEWIAIQPESFQLAPRGTQLVSVDVHKPNSAEPGDHQVTIVFVVPAEESSGNIKVNTGIGIPVFITAPGPFDDSVSLSNLNAPGFATGGPVTISASMQNTGIVHRDFRGNSPLTVDAPGTTTPFPDFTVTRGATRDISTTWDPPLIGIFNPTVTFTNADGSVQTASVTVIVFPIQKALILLGALLLLFFGFWFFRRSYRASVTKAAVAMNRPAGRGDD